MNDLTRELHDTQQKMAHELRGLVDDAQALLRHSVRDAGSEFTAASARLEKSLSGAMTSLEAAEKAARRRLGTAARMTGDYAQEHPWTTFGAVVGLGLLAAALIARR